MREKSHGFVCLTLFSLLTLGLLPCLFFDQLSLLCMAVSRRFPLLDHLAPMVTYLGDGWFYLIGLCLAALCGVSCRKLAVGFGSFLLASIVVQGLKRIIFPQILRPLAYLHVEKIGLDSVDGWPTAMSFPSGHAATIFTLTTLAYLLSSKKSYWLTIFYILVAGMVAYSRLYLYYHFYIDVYVGAWIGIIASLLVYQYLDRWKGPSWMDGSVYFFLRSICASYLDKK